MTEKVRIQIAALLTALFLGAVSAAGVLTYTPTPSFSAARSAQKARPAQPTPKAIPSFMREQESYD